MKIVPGLNFTLDELALPENAKPLTFIWVPPGRITMSDIHDAVETSNEGGFDATVSQGFWLCQYLITAEQWSAITGIAGDNAGNYPAANVSWADACRFCDLMNERYLRELPEGYRFSLPTEVQWEYACRAGGVEKPCPTTAELSDMAWHAENSGGRIHPVGEKQPNQWGFYDMLGNTYEWCLDRYAPYPTSPTTDRIGASGHELFVGRSSGYGTPPYPDTHAGGRFYCDGDTRRPWFCFRLALHNLKVANSEIAARQALSPKISHISWGRIDVDGVGTARDFKLYPGGGRQWDWSETGTHHVPGIQVADVIELLDQGSEVVILSRGMQLALKTCEDTLAFLKQRSIETYVEETRTAVDRYNQFAERGARVGGLFHSTC